MNYFCCSVSKLCPTFRDPVDCSTPSFPVLHYLLEFAHAYVNWVSDAIQPSHFLLPPYPPALNLSQHKGLFLKLFASGGQTVIASASAPVLPMNIQGWFPWGLTGLTSCCPRDSQESSPAPQFKSINSLVLNLLYGPNLTSIHGYWKNHSYDYIDLNFGIYSYTWR